MRAKPLFPTENLRSPAALARFFLTVLIGLGLDLWTKHIAFEKLAAGVIRYSDPEFNRSRWAVHTRPDLLETHGYVAVPHWLHFNVTVNEGAVFGIGQGKQMAFVLISIAAILFLTYLFATSGKHRLYQVVLGMLLAGVLGNMYDRVKYGYVRDMIYALPGWHWPWTDREVFPWIFNVADVLLCVGVGLIFLHSLFQGRSAKPGAAGGTTPTGTPASSAS